MGRSSRRRTRAWAVGLACAASLEASACEPRRAPEASADAASSDADGPAAPRPDMVWIPPGTLLAGTPPRAVPRVADEEMAGEQVVMRGFYIDVYPYPNEAGGLPTAGLSRDEARELCVKQGKRLCTELELERACKGPDNHVYAYGDDYKPHVCETERAGVSLRPNGFLDGCVSAFGVRDLHGSIATWTSSQWRRPAAGERDLAAVRGGTGGDGVLTSRCASGRGLPPSARRADVGVRCCAGEPNVFEVVLQVPPSKALALLGPTPALAAALEPLAGDAMGVVEGTRHGATHDPFTLERAWLWSPVGGEQLVLGGGCAPPKRGSPKGRVQPLCGVLVTRPEGAVAADGATVPKLTSLLFASSGHWQPRLHLAASPPPHPHRRLELVGADARGAFVTMLSFEWGRVSEGAPDRARVRRGE